MKPIQKFQNQMNGKRFMLFMAFCLLLPSIHYTGLASQTVIPRELFIYIFSIVFVIAIASAETLRYNRFYLFSMAQVNNKYPRP